MSQDTQNTTAFIEAQQYSTYILENLPSGLLPDTFTRDVSDFGAGTTLNIKTVGSTTIQELSENEDPVYTAIDTGNVTLQITDFPGDAWYITDVLREDGSQIEQLHAMRAQESTRALQEYFETRLLSVANAAQTDANANTINGFAHRIASAETGNVMALSHFIAMKLAFDKANVPAMGRIAIVDPVMEATINGLTNIVNVSNNPRFEGVVTEGFASEGRFLRNIFGFDVYTSNRLPTGNFGDGTTIVTGGVANVFMCVSDDSTRPLMRAWRRMPRVETERDMDKGRDKFKASARLGFGAQRVDTLGVLVTSATNY